MYAIFIRYWLVRIKPLCGSKNVGMAGIGACLHVAGAEDEGLPVGTMIGRS